MVCGPNVMLQTWTGYVIEHALAGLAASITTSPVALVLRVDAVDLSVILKLQATVTDDEEPRIVMVHVVPALGENSRTPEADLPSAAMVPVNVDVGQTMRRPAVKAIELSVELAEIAAFTGVMVACAGVAAMEIRMRTAAPSCRARVDSRFMACLFGC
jgi:hypothetical protein